MPSELISTVVSSLVPILITLFFAWLSNRNEKTQLKNLVEDSKSRIELINEYVTSQNLVVNDPTELGEIKKTAANELYEIKTFLDNKLQSLEKASKRSDQPLQHFFLIYRMHTFLAGLFRALFFLTLVFSVPWSVILVSAIPYITDGPYLFLFAMSLPVILVALLFRWLAIKLDKPASTAQ